jgi:NADH-quinone oxidoreductase subunit C
MVGSERAEIVALRDKLGAGFLKSKSDRGETFICVRPDALIAAITELKENPDLAYDYFSECVGVDYSTYKNARDFDERFEVVYNLMSTKHFSRIFVKTAVNDGTSIPTLKHIFLGAEYPEKEIHDLFGVHFEGNELMPGERFLLPDDWIGYPLRKEVPLGGEDVNFAEGDRGPAVEDVSRPHAGESFEGKTGSSEVSGR